MGKKKGVKMSLTDFIATTGGESSSWADEMELPTAPAASTDAPRSSGGYGSRNFRQDNDVRPTLEDLPTRAPFTAYMANFPFSTSEADIINFFDGCEIVQIRIPTEHDSKKPKGFSYIEFKDRDSLFKAINLHGEDFNGRQVRISVAEQREQDEQKTASNWRRQGGPPQEEQTPKPADTSNTWRRAAPATPIAREGGFASRNTGGRANDSGERSAPQSSSADQVSSWRSAGGPRAPSGSTPFGARRNDNASEAPKTQAPTERKRLVLQPRTKPTN